MCEGRFGRAASRLIESEKNLYKEKAISKKLGKTLPEDTIKIPVIGEWDLDPVNNGSKEKNEQPTNTTFTFQPKSKTITIPNFTTLRKSNEKLIVPPVLAARTKSVLQAPMAVHPPKPRAIIGQFAQDDKIVFPAGTITTDLNDILKSKYKSPMKPIPPLMTENDLTDPQFLPLDLFDDSSFEEYSIDELMKDPEAYSRYQDLEGNIYWAKCTALEYNPQTHLFTIEWKGNGKRKQVGRFNIRFEKENPEKYEKLFPRKWLTYSVKDHEKMVLSYEMYGFHVTRIDTTNGYLVMKEERKWEK